MRRKLIKQGDNALTVTIPAKWTQINGLKAGDEVEIDEEENKVVIKAKTNLKKKEGELHINTDSEQIIRSNLNVLYRVGFDRIKVYFENQKQERIVRSVVESRLLGFEVIEHNPKYLLLENVTEPSEEKQETLLRRIFFIIQETFSLVEQDLKNKNFSNLEIIRQNVKNVDRYSNFCNRNISKKRWVEERVSSYWELHSRLLLIEHDLLRVYEQVENKSKVKISPKTLKIFQYLKDNFNLMFEGFSKKDLNLFREVNDNTKNLQDKEIFPALKNAKGEENLILYYCGSLSRLIYLCTVPLFAICY